jgi:hypothetical protein
MAMLGARVDGGQNLHIEYSYDSPDGPVLGERVGQLARLDPRVILADRTPTCLR